MKKSTVLALVLALGLMPGLTGSAEAQEKHAPKPIWGAMVGGLNDIQSITAALAVFDMKRAATITDGLVKRETFISKIESLPDVVKKGHAKVAAAATELGEAVKSGDEQAVAMKLGGVLAACYSCHYNVRDAERRKKMG